MTNQNESALDKFGFIQEERSLSDAFALTNLKIQNLADNVFQQSIIQNNKLWIYTNRKNLILKYEL